MGSILEQLAIHEAFSRNDDSVSRRSFDAYKKAMEERLINLRAICIAEMHTGDDVADELRGKLPVRISQDNEIGRIKQHNNRKEVKRISEEKMLRMHKKNRISVALELENCQLTEAELAEVRKRIR